MQRYDLFHNILNHNQNGTKIIEPKNVDFTIQSKTLDKRRITRLWFKLFF